MVGVLLSGCRLHSGDIQRLQSEGFVCSGFTLLLDSNMNHPNGCGGAIQQSSDVGIPTPSTMCNALCVPDMQELHAHLMPEGEGWESDGFGRGERH